MTDRFHGEQSILSSADDAIPVLPGDPPISQAGKAFYVGTGGHVIARTMSGQLRTWKNVASGTEINCRIDKIDAASTAADILIYV